MNRSLAVLLSCSLLLNACSLLPSHQRAQREAAAQALAKRQPPTRTTAADGTAIVGYDGVEIEKVEFRPGISSATVENLAKQQSCRGGMGAGLLSAPGPVEIYRMSCDNGKVFIARCELRQCRAM
jgi:hypothetical protein